MSLSQTLRYLLYNKSYKNLWKKKICLETSQWKKNPEELLKASEKQAKNVDTRDVDIWVQSKGRGGRRMKDAGPDSHL